MDSIFEIFIIIVMWVAIWDLLELIIDRSTRDMDDKTQTTVRVIIYVAMIAAAIIVAKKKGISFT